MRIFQLICVASVFVFVGCTTTPKTHFYTLHGIANGKAPTLTANPQYLINPKITYGIGPIFLPEALNQPGVVSHDQGQVLKLSLYNIWAGNLYEAVTRVLASNISELTGVDSVWPFPWDNRNRPTRQVRIVFEQFSGQLNGDVALKAKWALTESNGEVVLLQKRVIFKLTVVEQGYAPYVSALNELVNLLSIDIASQISDFEQAITNKKSR